MHVVVQGAFFFGALAINLTVVVLVGLIVNGRATAQNKHAVYEPILAAVKIGVEGSELFRIDPKFLRRARWPVFRAWAVLRNRGTGDKQHQERRCRSDLSRELGLARNMRCVHFHRFFIPL